MLERPCITWPQGFQGHSIEENLGTVIIKDKFLRAFQECQILQQLSVKQLNYFTFNVITLYVFILDNGKSILKKF